MTRLPDPAQTPAPINLNDYRDPDDDVRLQNKPDHADKAWQQQMLYEFLKSTGYRGWKIVFARYTQLGPDRDTATWTFGWKGFLFTITPTAFMVQTMPTMTAKVEKLEAFVLASIGHQQASVNDDFATAEVRFDPKAATYRIEAKPAETSVRISA